MTTLEAAGPNAAQIDFWNATAGPSWVAAQEGLDAELRPWGEKAMAALAPTAGERLVDVGCGCGATTLMLAERVGASGRVLGADISAPMLAVARRRTEGVAQVEFVQADAQTHRFGPTDGGFSRFGVMFFADPVAAFANLRAALTGRGRIAFVCWRALEENPWMTVPMARVAPLLPAPTPMPQAGAPGPFAFADRERLSGILTGAGFTRIEIERNDLKTGWGDLDASTRVATSVGPVATALRLNPQLADRLRRRCARRSRPTRRPRAFGSTPRPGLCAQRASANDHSCLLADLQGVRFPEGRQGPLGGDRRATGLDVAETGQT